MIPLGFPGEGVHQIIEAGQAVVAGRLQTPLLEPLAHQQGVRVGVRDHRDRGPVPA